MSGARVYPLLIVLFSVAPVRLVSPCALPPHDAQDGQSEVRPAAALQIALSRLQAESDAFRNDGRLTRGEADFAAGFEYADRIRPADLRAELCRTQGTKTGMTDPAIDGYIRWQLLSFTPDLTAFTDDEFRQFIENLPGLFPHPGAVASLHARFESLAEEAIRNADAGRRLQGEWDTVRTSIHESELLNHPSLRFRQRAIEEMIPHHRSGHPEAAPTDMSGRWYRAIMLMLHDLEDRIESGWETRWIKSQVTGAVKASKLDETLTREQRQELIRMVERLADRPVTLVVRSVSVYTERSDRPPDIGYSRLQVRRTTDAARWIAYLNGHDPTK